MKKYIIDRYVVDRILEGLQTLNSTAVSMEFVTATGEAIQIIARDYPGGLSVADIAKSLRVAYEYAFKNRMGYQYNEILRDPHRAMMKRQFLRLFELNVLIWLGEALGEQIYDEYDNITEEEIFLGEIGRILDELRAPN